VRDGAPEGVHVTFRFAGSMVSVVAFVALAWAGDDAKTYEIDWRPHSSAGAVETVTVHDAQDMVMTLGAATTPFKTQSETLDAVYVVRHDAVDAQGASTKRTLFLKSWKQTKDGATDDSLSGRRVEVDGETWKVADDKIVTAGAKKWLDGEFAKPDQHVLEKLEPPTRMTVGRTWKADPQKAISAFGGSDVPFLGDGCSVELTLVSAEGAPPDVSGRFECKLHFRIGGKIPNMPPTAKVSSDSVADITATTSCKLTNQALRDDRIDMTMKMDVDLGPQANGALMHMKMTGKQEQKSVAGGEIPEPVKPDVPAPGAK
jgi:hypothetical protein